MVIVMVMVMVMVMMTTSALVGKDIVLNDDVRRCDGAGSGDIFAKLIKFVIDKK